MNLRPRALQPGARVALVSPAGPVSPERIEVSLERCRALGLQPVLYPNAGSRDRFLAGTDEQRLSDLQSAFDDQSIDAVWALRGGYGTQRIVLALDLERQKKAPIPFIGFSDNTTIHVRQAALGLISFHGPHPGADFPPETQASFRSVLFDAEPAGELIVREEDPQPQTLVGGRAEAPLVGGNLALLAALCGTKNALRAKGRVLFLEDIGEPAYRVDRMLLQLEQSGVMEGAVGLAFGRFTGTRDDDPYPVAEVIAQFAQRIGVPAVCELPFGHIEHNCTLPVGVRALLDGDAATLSIVEAAVEE